MNVPRWLPRLLVGGKGLLVTNDNLTFDLCDELKNARMMWVLRVGNAAEGGVTARKWVRRGEAWRPTEEEHKAASIFEVQAKLYKINPNLTCFPLRTKHGVVLELWA